MTFIYIYDIIYIDEGDLNMKFNFSSIEHDDIEFKTDSGQIFKLIFKKPEYRAYKFNGFKWIDMKLGSSNPDPLKEYILKNFD